ncbi:MAG: ribonuclease HII [Syntrophomonadaceae bacterium]|nr:ribonuclease HII [Bacillota bacterium]
MDKDQPGITPEEFHRIEGMMKFERLAMSQGYSWIAGLDEAGRGPLAGPVVAGAVILPDTFALADINDSKQLTPTLREKLADKIKKQAISWAVAAVYPPYLDRINIYQATVEAMKMAVNSLKPRPDYLLIDAVKLTDIHIEQQSIIKGDTLSVSIAAASILAKVERDHTMEAFDSLYPGYGFARHKGYATKEHVQLLLQKGPCPIHRVSFEPVKSLVKGGTYGEQPALFE